MESKGLQDFLSAVGEPIHSLNTICVGVEGVATGVVRKPEDLNISWAPADPVLSARKARKFALCSALVYINEALLSYVRQLATHLDIAEDLKVAKEVEGAADRIQAVGALAPALDAYLTPMVVLMIRWRNWVVHRSTSEFDQSLRDTLHAHAETLEVNFARLDIDRTLENFDSKAVTLKDFTTLIAMTIRFVRGLDQEIAFKVNTVEDLAAYVAANELDSIYRHTVGVNGEAKQCAKFDGFLDVHFGGMGQDIRDELFERRYEVLTFLDRNSRN